VRSVAVDPSNTWFATGSADRTIKVFDHKMHVIVSCYEKACR
jgi:WD40 repeat protein